MTEISRITAVLAALVASPNVWAESSSLAQDSQRAIVVQEAARPGTRNDAKQAGRDGQTSEAVPFADLVTFDREVSRRMKEKQGEIEVRVTDRITEKQLPDRLDKWLTAIDSTGGEVQVLEPRRVAENGQTRAIWVLIPFLLAMAATTTRDPLHAPASKYNATVVLKEDAAGERIVDKVVFLRR